MVIYDMTPDEPLQFDTAAPTGAPSTSCAVCKQPVGNAYYTAGKAIICASCKSQIETAPPRPVTPPQILRSILFGCGGALLGAAVYYGVRVILHAEVGIVAIAVGWLVGRGVQLGAQGQRGRPFQIMALVLTYVGIALGYAPGIANGVVMALELPIMATFESGAGGALTGIIIAVGLAQAWTMNRDLGKPTFHGPFRVGAPA